jgi:hypothetical protein
MNNFFVLVIQGAMCSVLVATYGVISIMNYRVNGQNISETSPAAFDVMHITRAARL